MQKTEVIDTCRKVQGGGGLSFEPGQMVNAITGAAVPVYVVKKAGGESFELCSALSVVKRFRDEDGRGFGRVVQFRDEFGSVHTVPVLDEWTADNVAKTLQGEGLRIYALARPNLWKNYLLELIARYPLEGVPVAVRYRQPGWIRGANCFLLPSGHIAGNICGESPELTGAGTPTKWRRGSLEEWGAKIGSIAVKSKAMICAIGFALTGPLMPLAGIHTCFVHFKGESRTGKSNTARAAVSLWGSAAADSTLLHGWSATAAGLELWLQGANGAMIALDELKAQNSRRMDTPGTIYTIANEVPRGRGKPGTDSDRLELRRQLSWRLPVISTGEVDLAAMARERLDAGVYGRFAQVDACQADGFGIFDPEAYADNSEAMRAAEQIERAATEETYGAPAERFVAALCDELDKTGREAFGKRLQAQITAIRGRLSASGDSQEGDMLKRFALAEVALLEAVEWGALPDSFTPERIRAAIQWAASSALQNFLGSRKQLEVDMENLRTMFPQNRQNFIILIGEGDALKENPAPARPAAGYAWFPVGFYKPLDHSVVDRDVNSANFNGAAQLSPDELYLFPNAASSPVLAAFLANRSAKEVFGRFPDAWKIGKQEQGRAARKFSARSRIHGKVRPPSSRMISIKVIYE